MPVGSLSVYSRLDSFPASTSISDPCTINLSVGNVRRSFSPSAPSRVPLAVFLPLALRKSKGPMVSQAGAGYSASKAP